MSLISWALGCVRDWRRQLTEMPWSRTDRACPWRNLSERNSEWEAGEIRRSQSMQNPVDQGRGFSLALRTIRLLILVGTKQSSRWGRFLSILIQILYSFFFSTYLLSKHMKRCLSSLVIREMQINPSKIPSLSLQNDWNEMFSLGQDKE